MADIITAANTLSWPGALAVSAIAIAGAWVLVALIRSLLG